MVNRVLALLIGVLFMADLAHAGPIGDAIKQLSAQQELRQPSRVSDKPAGFEEWQRRLDQAGSERRRAKNMILLGLAVGVGGTVITSTSLGRDITDCVFENDCGRGAGYTVGWLGMLAGYGLTGYGSWKYVSAKDQLEDLDREGRTKGFLSWAPGPSGGVKVGVHLAF